MNAVYLGLCTVTDTQVPLPRLGVWPWERSAFAEYVMNYASSSKSLFQIRILKNKAKSVFWKLGSCQHLVQGPHKQQLANNSY